MTGYVRSGDTYTDNGAAGMIQEIMAHLEEEDLKVTFRMDSGYFAESCFRVHAEISTPDIGARNRIELMSNKNNLA